ncbi:LysR substrate-binding domain-containing protein [Deinococcus cellulosilyticus]|uniref:LysR family transcriptional regulator n=1 Tax=Deinococcus cellulosilyticus (strain DSM 18568 / NBRC 106333 / KACC 11606 / 5516J-15) TaxID=1223518 RepID=A0A511MYS5_DEIC1|nr:LysR family transcriptional regulator [Deinococcus cellulosilyticus]GEM45719.1 LysR family transcriptional regulator [Deinococcus cellulosilyticus NBRC 106333 = KACC 11606]
MLDRLKLQHLRYFIAVAEELHFSRAAQKVALSEWDLSEQVRTLEEMLGVSLLVRNPHQMELTPAGDLLLRGASQLMKDTLQLFQQVQEVGEAMQEQVRLGYHAPEMEPFLSPLLAMLLTQSGQNLSRTSLPEQDLREALLNREIDVAVGLLTQLQDDTLACQTLKTGHWVVVLPETHALASEATVPPQSLRSEPLLLLAQPASAPHPALEALHGLGIHPEIAYEPSQAETAEAMVEQGTGLWLTSSFMVENLPPGLTTRPIPDLGELELGVACRTEEEGPAQIAGLLVRLTGRS